MKAFILKTLCFLLCVGASLGTLVYWLSAPSSQEVLSLPGADKVPEGARNQAANIKIGEKFTAFAPELVASLNAEFQGKWTNFRGSNHDNIVTGTPALIEEWGDAEQRVQWKVALGEGHSAPVIYDGVVYLLDYNEEKKEDCLRAFSLKDGSEIWQRSYKVEMKRNHGFSRTIPAVNEDVVITMGPKCHVMAVDRKSGDLLWSMDLVKDFGSEVPQWYTGQCPLIIDGVVILAAGGTDTLLMGVNAKSGEILWKTANTSKLGMSHSSIMPMTYQGKKSYVYAALGGVVGISAEKGCEGEMLWMNSEWAPSVAAPSPVICGEDKIYLTAGYGAGGAMLQVSGDAAPFKAELIERHKPNEGFALEQQSAILFEGRLYGIMPKDAGANKVKFKGVSVDHLREYLVSSPQGMRFGLGPFIMADGKFYLLNDNGSMSIFRVVGDDCQVLDTAQLIKGQDAWGPIAYADGYMIMRDSVTMFCVDVQKERKE